MVQTDMVARRWWRAVMALLLAGSLGGCMALARPAFSETEQQHAEVPGMPGVRDWADAPGRLIKKDAGVLARAAAESSDGFVYLALSGGAEYGAYGAGVLSG